MSEGFITRRYLDNGDFVIGTIEPIERNTLTIPDLIGKRYFMLSIACNIDDEDDIAATMVYALQYANGVITILRGNSISDRRIYYETSTKATFDETTGTITLQEKIQYASDRRFHLGTYAYIGC